MRNAENTCLFCMATLRAPNTPCPRCGRSNREATNEAHQLPAGSILAGAYLVGSALGQGGFGITYVGWDLGADQKVAIKEYYPEGCVTRELTQHTTVLPLKGDKGDFFNYGRQKFVDEARMLARFNGDPCIVGVNSFFVENGTGYIVMDFIEGQTIKAYAASRGGRMGALETLRLLYPLTASLARVHDAGLLHRDISPDNIMLQPDGSVKLLDFGAARQISAEGERSNTINVKHGFAPEEQYRTHGEQGPWTDVYALCATIYRLTTGQTPPQALDRILSGDAIVPPSHYGADFIPAEEAALLHGLAVKGTERTRDMRQLAAELFAPRAAYAPVGPAGAGGYAQPDYRSGRGYTSEQPYTTGQGYAGQADYASRAADARPDDAGRKKKTRRGIIIGAGAGAVALVALIVVAMTTGGAKAGAATVQQATQEPKSALAAATPEPTTQPVAGQTEVAAAVETPAPTQAPIVTPALADNPDDTMTVGDFSISIYGKVCAIDDYAGGDAIVEIPAEIAGYPVTGIGYNAFYEQDFTEVILPEGLSYIDDYAFDSCENLRSVRLPESLLSIGHYAFNSCASLGTLDIPAGVHYIGPAAFDGCETLSMSISPENYCYCVVDGVIFSYDMTLLHTYLYARSDASYEIPASVREIGAFAFEDNAYLSTLVLGGDITSIGEYAFFSCDRLRELTIPASVTYIGEAAFAYADIHLNLAPGSTSYCMVDDVLFSYDMTLLHTYPHYLTQTSYTLPDSVRRIGERAFYDAMSLTSIILPPDLQEIGEFAFGFCEQLIELRVPDQVCRIGDLAFLGCYALKAIYLPERVTDIGYGVFALDDNVVIYAPSGSTAEQYAKDNELAFRAN